MFSFRRGRHSPAHVDVVMFCFRHGVRLMVFFFQTWGPAHGFCFRHGVQLMVSVSDMGSSSWFLFQTWGPAHGFCCRYGVRLMVSVLDMGSSSWFLLQIWGPQVFVLDMGSSSWFLFQTWGPALGFCFGHGVQLMVSVSDMGFWLRVFCFRHGVLA